MKQRWNGRSRAATGRKKTATEARAVFTAAVSDGTIMKAPYHTQLIILYGGRVLWEWRLSGRGDNGRGSWSSMNAVRDAINTCDEQQRPY